MTIRVEVLDEVGSGFSEAAMAALVEAVLTDERREGCSVEVALVEECVMADLNRRYRGEAGPTDVLSFPEAGSEDQWAEPGADLEEGPSGETVPSLGELVICPAVVFRYAVEEGCSPSRQMGWTIVHGTLHLLGYDHEIDHGEMREREQVLLTHLTGRLADLLPPAGR